MRMLKHQWNFNVNQQPLRATKTLLKSCLFVQTFRQFGHPVLLLFQECQVKGQKQPVTRAKSDNAKSHKMYYTTHTQFCKNKWTSSSRECLAQDFSELFDTLGHQSHHTEVSQWPNNPEKNRHFSATGFLCKYRTCF